MEEKHILYLLEFGVKVFTLESFPWSECQTNQILAEQGVILKYKIFNHSPKSFISFHYIYLKVHKNMHIIQQKI